VKHKETPRMQEMKMALMKKTMTLRLLNWFTQQKESINGINGSLNDDEDGIWRDFTSPDVAACSCDSLDRTREKETDS
jgi:hypothetical protein